jgi:uncharacterized protein YjbI with pentapeptide repeats
MANLEHVEILKQGVEVWNQWRICNPEIKPDLEFADFSGAYLCGANLCGSLLAKTNFSQTNLSAVNFKGSNLFEANFTDALLNQADFSSLYLRNVNFTKADSKDAIFMSANIESSNLTEANFNHVFLVDAKVVRSNLHNTSLAESLISFSWFVEGTFTNTDFSNAFMGSALFADCDLSTAKGLQTVQHDFASTIGIDTFYKSDGKIPEVFLRGCGVPEDFITYAKSLTTNPIDFYSCFISFTEKDDAFSERLYNDMQAKGVRCWRWKEDAKWGRTLRKEIDEAVRYYDKLVVICSKDSLKAPAVLEEIERALDKEDDLKRKGEDAEVLFPIRIDDFIFDGWESELKVRLTKKNIGDFRDWNGDAEKYRKSVERLVKDLNRPRK